jgi:hypothetical protein
MTQPVDTALDGQPEDIPAIPLFAEGGLTGLRRAAGYVDEEFLPQLRGRKAVQVYREMADNEAVVGALLFAIDRLLRNVDWRVKAGEGPQAQEAADFLDGVMNDMSHTWDDFISEILTMLPYGWSWHEICYKRRVGPWEKDPKNRSKFTDGKIGWRKIPIRAQETLFRWVFDEHGGTKAMIQMAPPYYQSVTLPIEKSLLFRVSSVKGNPEGRSLLRNAYRSWFYKKRIEEIEGIGAERDLAGMPIARVPMRLLTAQPGTKDADTLAAFRKMVRTVRRDEQDGVIFPREIDPETKQDLYDFGLLSSGGSRQFDTNGIISRYEQRILMTVLADFILVGHENVGSYALHTDKSGLFRSAINSIAESIADVLNRYAVPRLFEVNGWKLDDLPTIEPSDVDPPDLTQLGQFMTSMSAAGVQWFPDPELEKFLRQAARLPELDEDQLMVRETEEKQSFIQRLAQQRLEMINLSAQAQGAAQQMQSGQMGLEQQKMQMEAGGEDPQAAQQQMLAQGDEKHKLAMGAEQQKMKFGEAANKQKLTHTEQMHQIRLQAAKKAASKPPTPASGKKPLPKPPAKGKR